VPSKSSAPLARRACPTRWHALVLCVWQLVAAFSIWQTVGVAAQPIDAEAQEKVIQLLQKVIERHWEDSASTQLTNKSAIDTNVEAAFRTASELLPQRLDLRFGIASALVGQAVQTNGTELSRRVEKALGVYRDIEAMDPRGFAAPAWYAALSSAIRKTNEANSVVNRLISSFPAQGKDYAERFKRVEARLQMTLNTTPDKNCVWETNAIIVLGAGLETNGTMKPKLVERLRQGLRAAKLNRSATVIVTGGNQKAGVTEAYMMSKWLMEHGIGRKRIVMEDKARDTVENAVFCAAILKRLRVNHVTVVTSASHLRRGVADLEEACFQKGLEVAIDGVAAAEKKNSMLDPEQERLAVYRDVMRVSGLWAFPGLQR